MSRALIIAGALLLILGLAWPFLSRLGLGRLPGDIVLRREGLAFYFPIVTCLVLSGAATFLLWLLRR